MLGSEIFRPLGPGADNDRAGPTSARCVAKDRAVGLGKEGPQIVLIEPGAVLVINKPSLGVLPVTAWPGGHYCVAVIAHANWQRAVRSDSRWRIK
jgi:hypothetical protein